jgi:SPP1 gp7 family putative phage head morphogenesis protein
MAVRRDTLRLLHNIRVALDRTVDAATVDLVKAWARAWDTLALDWEASIRELQGLRDDGKWPTRRQIDYAERTQKALFYTHTALIGLGDYTGVSVRGAMPSAVHLASAHLDVIASQFPPKARTDPGLALSFNRISRSELEAIVRRTSQQVTSLTLPLSAEATDALYRELIRGVAYGTHPNTVARVLLRRLEGRFNGGLARAMVIARTEILDAHRTAAAETHRANAEVLTGWQWIATLDDSTCPGCWAEHGGIHPLDEDGPDDHQQGRCARLPVTKPWEDLGFNVKERPSVVPDAQSVFAKLPAAAQVKVMGQARLDLLDSGSVNWSDLSTRRSTRGWRDSRIPTPVRDLRGAAR